MVGLDVFDGFDVGDGAGNFENFVVGAGAEAQFVNSVFQQGQAFVIDLAELANLSASHLAIGANRHAVKSRLLPVPSLMYLLT